MKHLLPICCVYVHTELHHPCDKTHNFVDLKSGELETCRGVAEVAYSGEGNTATPTIQVKPAGCD